MKKWLIYDARYRTDEDRAICLLFCDSLQEARREAPEYGDENVIVEATIVGKEIVSEKIVN